MAALGLSGQPLRICNKLEGWKTNQENHELIITSPNGYSGGQSIACRIPIISESVNAEKHVKYSDRVPYLSVRVCEK